MRQTISKSFELRSFEVVVKMRILCMCGSLRRGSYNALVAKALETLAPADMDIVAAPTFRNFPLYDADLQQDEGFPADVILLGEALRSAEGIIIVTPEYNYSIPGALKNALDWLSRLPAQPFAHKPVAIQTAANSMLGGARAQYHLRQVLVFLEALVFNRPEIFINNVRTKFDESSGELVDMPTRIIIEQQLGAFQEFIGRLGARK